MSKRIFQHYQGHIGELQGKTVLNLYSVEDEVTQQVYLLWLQLSPGNKWYRIFVDELCCVVDEYNECMITDDLVDDDVLSLDLTSKYKEKIITKTLVFERVEPFHQLVFSIRFQGSGVELVSSTEKGNCFLVHDI